MIRAEKIDLLSDTISELKIDKKDVDKSVDDEIRDKAYDDWNEVRLLVEEIEKLFPKKEYLNNSSLDGERQILINKFNDTFKNINDDDSLKFDVLTLLNRLGITPTKKIKIENKITKKNKFQ
jgi:predicted Zn-dependent peptidase